MFYCCNCYFLIFCDSFEKNRKTEIHKQSENDQFCAFLESFVIKSEFFEIPTKLKFAENVQFVCTY